MSVAVVLREVTPPKPRKRSPRWGARGVSALLALLTVGMFFFAGGFSGAGQSQPQPAAAIPGVDCAVFGQGRVDDPADPKSLPLASATWPGVFNWQGNGRASDAGSINGFGVTSKDLYGDRPVTAYEHWGTGGLQWSEWPAEKLGDYCTPDTLFNKLLVVIPEFTWTLVVGAGQLGIYIFEWAASVDAFGTFVDLVGEIISGFTEQLYGQYLAIIVLLATLWIAWQGLVKKRFRDGVQGTIWMILAGGLGFVFLVQPAAIMTWGNTVVQTVTTSVIGAGATAGSSIADRVPSSDDEAGRVRKFERSLCSGASQGNDGDTTIQGTRYATCALWQTFLYQPWSFGQFGGGSKVLVKDENAKTTLNTAATPPTLAGHWMSLQTREHDFALNTDLTKEEEAAILEERQEQYGYFWDALSCGGQDPLYENVGGIAVPDPAADYCAAYAAHDGFTGRNYVERVIVQFVALFGMILGMGPLILLAFLLVIYQFSGLILFLVAPLVLLLGVHPGFGRKLTMGWLEMLASNALKRIGTAFLMSLMLVMFTAIGSSMVTYLAQVVLIIASGVGLLLVRGKIMDKLSSSVQFDGGGAGQTGHSTGKMVGGMGLAALAGSVAGARLAQKDPNGNTATGALSGMWGGIRGQQRRGAQGGMVSASATGVGEGRSLASQRIFESNQQQALRDKDAAAAAARDEQGRGERLRAEIRSSDPDAAYASDQELINASGTAALATTKSNGDPLTPEQTAAAAAKHATWVQRMLNEDDGLVPRAATGDPATDARIDALTSSIMRENGIDDPESRFRPAVVPIPTPEDPERAKPEPDPNEYPFSENEDDDYQWTDPQGVKHPSRREEAEAMGPEKVRKVQGEGHWSDMYSMALKDIGDRAESGDLFAQQLRSTLLQHWGAWEMEMEKAEAGLEQVLGSIPTDSSGDAQRSAVERMQDQLKTITSDLEREQGVDGDGGSLVTVLDQLHVLKGTIRNEFSGDYGRSGVQDTLKALHTAVDHVHAEKAALAPHVTLEHFRGKRESSTEHHGYM